MTKIFVGASPFRYRIHKPKSVLDKEKKTGKRKGIGGRKPTQKPITLPKLKCLEKKEDDDWKP